MKYLLNSKVKILAFERVEQEDGAFVECLKSAYDFFCEADLKTEGMGQVLRLILRENSMLKFEILKVIFKGITYNCVSCKVVEDGFLEILCKI
jgi:hypothetical protein